MRRWRVLIIIGSATSALAIGLGTQAQADQTGLVALVANAWMAIS